MRLYKINETLQHLYYQMPQELFKNEKYKYLSIEAKVIYSFLLNRMNLSKISHWINNAGERYLIYTRKEIQSKLNYLKPDTQIHNSTNFMISCLYNAITEYYSDSDLQFKIDYGSG